MMSFEYHVNLMHPNNISASLDQHVSAMRMDQRYAWTGNQLLYAITDWGKFLCAT